jgi:hypothetical protein
MIYVNPLNDLLATTPTTTSTGTNQINYANKYILTNNLAQTTPSQVRSSSTSSSISSVSSTSTSPQTSNSQINTKTPDLINNQIIAKNLPLQTSLYPTYTTTGYTYLNPNYIYSQPNTRLLTNTANLTNGLTSFNEKCNFSTIKVLKIQSNRYNI